MSYKNITVLTERESGTLEISELAVVRCDSATGWGVLTPGDPDPINGSETTELRGWGELDGEAIVHRAYRIPKTALV